MKCKTRILEKSIFNAFGFWKGFYNRYITSTNSSKETALRILGNLDQLYVLNVSSKVRYKLRINHDTINNKILKLVD